MLQGGPLVDEQLAGRAPWLLLGGGVLLLLTGVGYVLSWYFTRYQVAEGYVRINTGFLFKQQRQARLDRVQAIDIVQPLLARIFGLAELKFEVADAGESAVRLAYLRMDEARQLRATILARAAGVVPDPAQPGAAAAEAPEHAVLTVPPGRLIGSLLLSEQSVVVIAGAAGLRGALRRHREPQLLPLPDPRRAGHGGRVLERHQQGLQLHRRHLPGRHPAAVRAAGHPGPDPAAGTDPGPARQPAAAVADPRLVPDPGQRGRLRRRGQQRRGLIPDHAPAGGDLPRRAHHALPGPARPGHPGTGADLHRRRQRPRPCRAFAGEGAGEGAGGSGGGCRGFRDGRRRLRHHPAARPAAGPAGLAAQRLHRHRHGPADPLGPLVAAPRCGPAPAHPVHGPGAGPPGPALPGGGPGAATPPPVRCPRG